MASSELSSGDVSSPPVIEQARERESKRVIASTMRDLLIIIMPSFVG